MKVGSNESWPAARICEGYGVAFFYERTFEVPYVVP